MANDFKKFADRMRAYGTKVVTGSARIQREVALAIDAAVVIATPVDTGRARANWQASLDHPAVGTREPFAEGKEGSTAGPNSQGAIDQAKSVIAGHKPGQVINITNNLAYIGKLNEGSSAQAPAGYVEQAVIVASDTVRARANTILEG